MPKTPVSRRLLIVLILALLFYCLDFFFRIAPSIVVPQLMQQYHITALGMGGFASAFYLGYVLFQLPSGWLLDRFRFNPLIIVAILICTLAFISFVHAHHYWEGYWLRLLIGASSAFSFVGILFLARRYFPPQYFSIIAGIAIGAGTIAASGTQVLGAWLMDFWQWQQVLIWFSCLGILIAVLLLLPPLWISRRIQPSVISNDFPRASWQTAFFI